MRPVAPLGAPARVVVRMVVRPTYRLEWEYDGLEVVGALDEPPDFEPVRRVKVETYFSRAAAYRAAALRLIFVKRDRLATGRDGFKATGCRACAAVPFHPEQPDQCKYHGGDGFEVLVARLARWLRSRDDAAASQPTAGTPPRGER